MTANETRDLMWMGSPIQNNCYIYCAWYILVFTILNKVSIISQIIMAVFLEHKLCNKISFGPMCISIFLAAKALFAVKFAAEGAMCHITSYSWKKSAAIVKVI